MLWSDLDPDLVLKSDPVFEMRSDPVPVFYMFGSGSGFQNMDGSRSGFQNLVGSGSSRLIIHLILNFIFPAMHI